MAYLVDGIVFAALVALLGLGAAWRWQHPDDVVAAHGYRAAVWLLAASGASLLLRLAGIV